MTRPATAYLQLSPDVEQALVRERPVVALESALIAQGFPSPTGAEVAYAAEERVRRAGAVPATVAVLDGAVRVGIGPDDIDRLARTPDVRKVGPREIATATVSGLPGATTVAGTLVACRIAGIHFLATGGIGGVHRGWARTNDVSADLEELARTPVCVICSGAKSILDVGATLERLETLGIPVIGFGTDRFPLFYHRDSPFPLGDHTDDPATAAALAAAHWGFARTTGVLVTQPVAAEAALPAEEIEPLVEETLAAAEDEGIAGGAVTPYVLSRLHARTGGRTLRTNRRLIEDNAELAARIAIRYYSV